MKLKILTGGLLLASCLARAQSGVSTQGGTCYWDNGSLQWTIGETIVSTLQTEEGVLTQGFDQHEQLQSIVTATTIIAEKIKVEVFPNPVAEQLTISIGEVYNEVHYTLMAIDGKQVLSGEFQAAQHGIDFSSYAPGAYMLILRQTNQPLKSFKIVKK